MFEIFLFNVTVGGLILSMGGLAVLELTQRFKKKYKIVKRNETSLNNIKRNITEKRDYNIKIAKNNGMIDIRMSKSENGVA